MTAQRVVLRAALAAGVAVAAAAPAARAVAVASWVASSLGEFSQGTLDGTALDEEGQIRLAPEIETLWGPAAGIVWGLAPADAQGAFVALSSPGRLLRIVAAGRTPETWFEGGEESLVATVAADGAGGAYFGVSPEGRLFHARGPQAVTELGVTGASFIWALAVGREGVLWVGTGAPGTLQRYRPGEGLVQLFDAEDDPVRCLLALDDGSVVLGTGGRGRIVRVDAAGRAFVLLDAEENEIVALAAAEHGVLYALAAQGSKQVGRPPASRPPAIAENVRVTASPGPAEAPSESPQAAAEPGERQAPLSFRIPSGAALYRLTADGAARRLWESSAEVPFTLARTAGGRLLVATGDHGRVYQIDERGRSAMLLAIASDQASAMASTADGRVLIGGTSDARVERLGPKLREQGDYVTVPIDAGTVADWGRLRWEADLPHGSKLRVKLRAGNTSTPDRTWSDWLRAESTGPSEVAGTGLPSARWFQARLELESSAAGASPAVRRIEVFYRTKNRRPAISSLTVQPPGVVWTRNPAQTSRPAGPQVAADPISRRTADGLEPGVVSRQIRKSYELGARTVSWEVQDPDGDGMRFRLEIRREGARGWLPLAHDLDETFYGFDARELPDGLYRLRVTATDAPDNPEGKALDDEEVSAAFAIDNTRPVLDRPEIRRSDDGVRVEFLARDPDGGIAAVEVAVDDGSWMPLDPLDGVADSTEERYRMLVEPRPASTDGERTLRVRVTDAAGNLGGDAWSLAPRD